MVDHAVERGVQHGPQPAARRRAGPARGPCWACASPSWRSVPRRRLAAGVSVAPEAATRAAPESSALRQEAERVAAAGELAEVAARRGSRRRRSPTACGRAASAPPPRSRSRRAGRRRAAPARAPAGRRPRRRRAPSAASPTTCQPSSSSARRAHARNRVVVDDQDGARHRGPWSRARARRAKWGDPANPVSASRQPGPGRPPALRRPARPWGRSRAPRCGARGPRSRRRRASR